MAFQAALTFGDDRAADSDQLLRLQVERAGLEITFLVELQVNVAKTRLDHAHRRRSLLRGLGVFLCHIRLHLRELDAADATFVIGRKSRGDRQLTTGIYRPLQHSSIACSAEGRKWRSAGGSLDDVSRPQNRARRASRLCHSRGLNRGFAPRDDQLGNLDVNRGTEAGLALNLEGVVLAIEYLQPLLDIADTDAGLIDLVPPVLRHADTIVDNLDA